MKLLDVGSCYNPFTCYEDLDVMAVDLCPAVDSVYQCDFLTVPIQQDMIIDEGKVLSLKRNHFQCVIFSFLLEYLPSPAQRWACCCKAQKVLTDEGLLLIITPDSKAAHSNAKVMKSWREAMETIGFKRIKYEKLQHAHCMAFRKNDNIEPEDIAAQDVSAKMYIPQDHQNFSDSDDDDCYIRYTEEELLEGFSELPKFCIDLWLQPKYYILDETQQIKLYTQNILNWWEMVAEHHVFPSQKKTILVSSAAHTHIYNQSKTQLISIKEW